MKSLFTCILALTSTFIFAQAYTGKGDMKFSIAGNLQENGSGITAIYDIGYGENISFGVSGTYLLGVTSFSEEFIGFEDAEGIDRIDLKARFNANLGSVLNIDENFDLYPGLNLGLRNFGGHLGARYFFTNGFGVFAEMQVPFAYYIDQDEYTPAEALRKTLNNQFNVNIGATFNLM